ncbi:MAG: LLM class flavin-dependent oxidoreductase [Dehalococcoidia bacterium]|nr:LLM class flavin-dependent oxidoreductase [Dehalococcoidia bacterium]
MRFGLVYDFRNPAAWRKPWPEVYQGLLQQVTYAEELGYDSIWLTEHHFVEDGYTPSPVPIMAAIAARTRRVEISTDILILPLYHPVKLAEDIATIDIISNGRVMLGVGSGYRDEEFAAFGTSRKERGSRMEEGVAVLRGCWGDAPFSFSGRHYQLDSIDVVPKPVQRPHPPLWMAATAEPAARRAARLGLHLLPQADRAGGYDAWLDELAKHGRDPRDYRIGMIKAWFVSAQGRDDAVWHEARERERYRAGTHAPWLRAGYIQPGPGIVPIDQSYMVGTPAEVIRLIDAQAKELPLTDIIGWATPPGMDPQTMNPYLERFAREVMPHFR